MVTFCVCVITWIPGFIFWKMRWSWTCLSIHIIFMCHVMCNLYLPHNSHVFFHLVFIAFSKKPPNMTLPICTESCQNVNRFHVNVILFCVNKITWWIFGIIPALILWSISSIYSLSSSLFLSLIRILSWTEDISCLLILSWFSSMVYTRYFLDFRCYKSKERTGVKFIDLFFMPLSPFCELLTIRII